MKIKINLTHKEKHMKIVNSYTDILRIKIGNLAMYIPTFPSKKLLEWKIRFVLWISDIDDIDDVE